MTPEIYCSVLLMTVLQNSVVTAFSLANFFANDGTKILVNSAAQYAGYLFTQLPQNQITMTVVPVLYNTWVTGNYVHAAGNIPDSGQRALIPAIIYTAAGIITKTVIFLIILTELAFTKIIKTLKLCLTYLIQDKLSC